MLTNDACGDPYNPHNRDTERAPHNDTVAVTRVALEGEFSQSTEGSLQEGCASDTGVVSTSGKVKYKGGNTRGFK